MLSPSSCISRCQMLLKIDFTRYGLKTIVCAQQNQNVRYFFMFNNLLKLCDTQKMV